MNFKNWLTKADEIKEQCQPFLRMTDQPLYRGVKVPITGLFVKAKLDSVRQDRKPRDSNATAHKLVDDWFFEKYNLRPRSQGLFCTANSRAASQYGKLAYVFPVGNFKYIWGADEDMDPFTDSLRLMNRVKNNLSLDVDNKVIVNSIMKTCKFYVNEGLEDAQDVNAEIILFCDEVILVPTNLLDTENAYIKFIRSLGV